MARSRLDSVGETVRGSSAPETLVTVSIDTEEDNWVPARNRVTVENVRQLPRMQAWLRQLGVRPTYFTNYQVFEHDWSCEIMKRIHDSGDAEVGAHLHPWNTPPLEGTVDWSSSMLCNLPLDLQQRKLATLTERVTGVLGAHPAAFRAGRFGLGASTVTALLALGYRVDSSVTPHLDWTPYGGPDHRGAPNSAYRLSGGRDPRLPDPDGRLVELPVSSGYNRAPFRVWGRVDNVLNRRPFRTLRIPGIASRLGLLRRITLSPETDSVADMLALSHKLISQGAGHLMLLFHSPTLVPGLSPFARRPADVDVLYRKLAEYVEALARSSSVRFATATEAADALIPVMSDVRGSQ